jgi:hypothetical protein
MDSMSSKTIEPGFPGLASQVNAAEEANSRPPGVGKFPDARMLFSLTVRKADPQNNRVAINELAAEQSPGEPRNKAMQKRNSKRTGLMNPLHEPQNKGPAGGNPLKGIGG